MLRLFPEVCGLELKLLKENVSYLAKSFSVKDEALANLLGRKPVVLGNDGACGLQHSYYIFRTRLPDSFLQWTAAAIASEAARVVGLDSDEMTICTPYLSHSFSLVRRIFAGGSWWGRAGAGA